ncbi:hypothetical protein [Sphingomonas quercus]|uniref:Tetratricopeptide repeat protein n=1 Tax=Sphingomonas quercus TaxID=2842451 RepID=A0ABS6BK33_9SPHN|nr:hypothetical protein [Sphingomonas quercus]MBU3078653.1 hypothetical protein [Sphingomonas quercus]
MKTALLLASAALAATPAVRQAPLPAAPAAPVAAPTPVAFADPSPQVSAQARIPGFAADLAQRPSIAGPADWLVVADEDSWKVLARAHGEARQEARWAYARSLIGRNRGAEAIGVLDVMQQDDPDLAMVDSFQLARAVTLVQMNRLPDALATLSRPGLAANPEACAWRMRALSQQGFAAQALGELRCAREALVKRPLASGTPFLLDAAHAAVAAGKPDVALRLLAQLPDRDAAANLGRGQAYVALGKTAEARLRFARVVRSGTRQESTEAALSQIEASVAEGSLKPAAALRQLDALRFAWRGDAIEERALRLSYKLASDTRDLREALSAGATLFRFYDPTRQGPDFVMGLQEKLLASLDAANGLPLDQAAGLFWDYRDLTPSGAEGDALLAKLADRLQTAGLYGRAADLFEHQLFNRARDLSRGPLSVRVASLRILAGQPDRAVIALRRSAQQDYTPDMLRSRARVEAVALSQLGKVQEAFAVIQDLPDAGSLKAEILWKRHDWQGLAAETAALPANAAALSDVDQAIVLRHAIAYAMIGRDDGLVHLRERYSIAFAKLPTGPVFDMLTTSIGTVDPDKLARAMAAMPTASPVGELAALIDAQPLPVTKKKA